MGDEGEFKGEGEGEGEEGCSNLLITCIIMFLILVLVGERSRLSYFWICFFSSEGVRG